MLERLRELDPIAYLRFSSVYKGFEDLADFEREVGELQRDLARRDLGGSLQKTTEPKGPTRPRTEGLESRGKFCKSPLTCTDARAIPLTRV